MTSPPVLPPFDAEARRRLDSVGWLQDGRALEPLRAIWSGPDPIGAVERVVAYLEASLPDLDPLTDPTLALRLAHLAGGSRELMSQLTRHPTWLAGAEPGDLRGVARSTLAAVAAQALRLAHLAGGSRELMSQLTRHPTWLAGAEPGDLRGVARSTLAAVAAQDLA